MHTSETDIKIYNDLIADFMGVWWKEDKRNGSYYVGNVPVPFPTSLGYQNSYAWIMPVIEKIESFYYKGFPIVLEDNSDRVSKTEAIYLAVARFVYFYNKHKEDFYNSGSNEY